MATDRRNYNVFFNTHTVSGIVISVGLFVCFFAGAFALFLNEINYWEANAKREGYQTEVDYDRLLTIADEEGYDLEGRTLFMSYREGTKSYLQVSGQVKPADSSQVSEDTQEAAPVSKEDSLANSAFFLMIDPESYEVRATEFDRSTKELGTFLYHLHYFEQIPAVGIYLAGLVALFFAFAIFTGIIVHWKKIVSNFFTFRLKGSVKNLWTDAHTALGVIGLPFQLMYAVTGAFFGLIILLYIPFLTILYDGDQEKMFEIFRPAASNMEVPPVADVDKVSINTLVSSAIAEFDPSELDFVSVQVKDYQEENAELVVNTTLDSKEKFMASSITTFRLSDGAKIGYKPIDENKYVDVAPALIGKLHFARFGGYLLKAVYFVLALITCFVIMSGVMIWLTARDKKMYAHKAKFNQNVGAIYLGACMGLFPSIALFFCMVKLFPLEMANRYDIMPGIFFGFWLAYIIYSYFIKSTYKINQHALYLAGVMGLLIPGLNGLQSGLWFWKSFQMGYLDSFFIDTSWLVMGVTSILCAFYAKPVVDVRKARKAAASKKKAEPVGVEAKIPQLVPNAQE